jgi:predicted TIM-barrel fold metal-dependent hydrolase
MYAILTDLSKTFVDSHLHVFAAGVAQAQARYVPRYDAPLAAWQQASRPLGVARGVLVQPSFLGTDNSRLVRELAANPLALRGVVVVSADTDGAELERLNDAGVRGLRLNLAGVSHRIEPWTRARRLWDAVLALDWHLELHTDTGALPETLAQLPADLPLVIDHMGRPDSVSGADPTVQALVRRALQGSVHVKLSGPYRLGGRDAGALARLWLGELGLHTLLWGSDWPCTNHESEANYPALFDALYDWVGDQAVPAILVDNPTWLYWRTSPHHLVR